MHHDHDHSICIRPRPTINEVTLTFKRYEILDDIKNISFVEADIIQTEDEHQKHQVFDIGEDGNVDRVTRVMSLAVAEVTEMLYPYSVTHDIDDEEYVNDLTEPEVYDITMRLPKEFSFDTVRLLKHLIHEYIIDRILEDWLSITKPSSQANWRSKLEEIAEEIRRALVYRKRPLRRKMSPF
jgi:hypothetical protein